MEAVDIAFYIWCAGSFILTIGVIIWIDKQLRQITFGGITVCIGVQFLVLFVGGRCDVVNSGEMWWNVFVLGPLAIYVAYYPYSCNTGCILAIWLAWPT